jgi:hypothetical protein
MIPRHKPDESGNYNLGNERTPGLNPGVFFNIENTAANHYSFKGAFMLTTFSWLVNLDENMGEPC